MTRKHFRALAAALATTCPGYVSTSDPDASEADLAVWQQWRTDVEALAAVLRQLNPNFDRERFLNATQQHAQD